MDKLEKATPQVSGTDISALPEIETAIVARQRQILRNTAVQINLLLALAKKRHAVEEVKALGKQLDTLVQDIAELDALYPGAKQQMDDFDARAVQEGWL